MSLYKILLTCLFFITLVSCALSFRNIKLGPEYKDVDPILVPYVDMWLAQAKDHGLKFDKTVTAGFKNIEQGRIVGLCSYGVNWREIDFDKTFWKNASEIGKTMLVYHESTHAYCTRGHDYGDGTEYGDAEKSRKDPDKKDGFFGDKCPKSLMFPETFDDICFLNHYQEYMDEMFNRCIEY